MNIPSLLSMFCSFYYFQIVTIYLEVYGSGTGKEVYNYIYLEVYGSGTGKEVYNYIYLDMYGSGTGKGVYACIFQRGMKGKSGVQEYTGLILTKVCEFV